MPLQLIRKFSFRHKKSSEKEVSSVGMRKSVSCKGLLRLDKSVETPVPDKCQLPSSLIHRILDMTHIVDQIIWRAVNKDFKNHVDGKMAKIDTLSVRKVNIGQATTSDWFYLQNSQVALKITENTSNIVVDSKWTSRDIQSVVGLMSMFRSAVKQATIDAPIAELLVVSLSALDLNRWYAFQCYMKAMDAFDSDMHLDCDFTHPGKVYWPNLVNLTIRTTEKEAPHLARVIDYGVQCNWVLDRRNLDLLRIVFSDLDSTSREVKRHLYHFRCWAGSLGFDHRFEQQFGVLI